LEPNAHHRVSAASRGATGPAHSHGETLGELSSQFLGQALAHIFGLNEGEVAAVSTLAGDQASEERVGLWVEVLQQPVPAHSLSEIGR
jgi:hypothetical protein